MLSLNNDNIQIKNLSNYQQHDKYNNNNNSNKNNNNYNNNNNNNKKSFKLSTA